MNKLNQWLEFKFKVDTKLITGAVIHKALEEFFESTKVYLDPSLFINILFKVRHVSGQLNSIAYMQIIPLSDVSHLGDIFEEFWMHKEEEYHSDNYTHIVFTYKLSETEEGLKTKKEKKVIRALTEENKPHSFSFGGFKLPNTMDIIKWGNVEFNAEYTSATVSTEKSNTKYKVNLDDRHSYVSLNVHGKPIISFKDTVLASNNLGTFKRELKGHLYYFIDGKLELKLVEKKVEFIGPIKKAFNYELKIITMDVETRTLNGDMKAYCISIYDGSQKVSFYLSDYSSEKNMIQESIKFLMKRKYHGYKVYIHNFSNFDVHFLLTSLSELSNRIVPIIRNGRFIDFKVYYNKYVLSFRDSYLILPSSLRKLAHSFNVSEKGLFPYAFVNNPEISLTYEGLVPEFKYFNDISLEEYISYKNMFQGNWNLKNESTKYCELDCIVLYEIIDSFSKRIYEKYRINITKYSTLPSLAFAIFRSHYLKDNKIPSILSRVYDFMKEAFTGGAVDVYKPFSLENEKVYRYDVNSLYPYVMRNFPMPVGQPVYFEGNILETYNDLGIKEKPFGIFEVEITAPDINIPILQTKLKTRHGLRTVAPIGKWTGRYFSEELYNAQSYGYNFIVKKGFLFEKAYLFKEYVDDLYEMKKQSTKNEPDYIISKLLMNSLFGRIGMSPEGIRHCIINSNEGEKYYSNYIIKDVIDLKNGKEIISYIPNREEYDMDSHNNLIKNVSVPTAVAITAYARIHMAKFKSRKDLTVYYSDTDSIDINKKLDPEFVGKELGEMKLEHIFNEAIYIAPKVYGGRTDEYDVVKVKGLKNPISFDELKSLLTKDNSIKIQQEKWYKDPVNSKILVKDEIYTLMATDSKRKIIFNEKNKFIDTKPIKLVRNYEI